jgi:uncharacterized membrane protein
MKLKKEWNRLLQSWPWWRWIITGLSLLAALLSISLSWHYLSGGQMVGCSGGNSCDQVLNSKWSMLAGVLPVSSLAVGVYLALFVASFFIGIETEESVRRLAWQSMLVLVGAVAGSALWFIVVQKWFVGAFCPYCMSTHLSGLLLTVLVISQAVKRIHTTRPLQTFGSVFAGLALAGMLAGFQVWLSPKSVYKDGDSQQNLPTMDFRNAPMVGPADAPNKIIMLFDYNCSHCQKIHVMLRHVVDRYKGRLAFVLCPTPLNTKCNPYVPRDVDAFKNSCELAKTGLALWSVDRNAFSAFENWMFTYESGEKWFPRTLKSAREKAVELVGSARFEAALSNPWIENYLQTGVRAFGQTLQNGKGGVPKLIFGSRWVIPEPENSEDLVRILQTSLSLPKP